MVLKLHLRESHEEFSEFYQLQSLIFSSLAVLICINHLRKSVCFLYLAFSQVEVRADLFTDGQVQVWVRNVGGGVHVLEVLVEVREDRGIGLEQIVDS